MNQMDNDLFYQSIIGSYIKENPRFLRRDNLVKEIHKAIDQDFYRFVLITGAPLTGKSTIMAQLAMDNPGWLRYFIRRDQRSPLGDPGVRSFLLQCGFQFAALHPELFKPAQIHASVETIVKRVERSGSVVSARINRIIASPFVQTVLEVRTQVEEAGGDIRGLEVGEWVSDPRLLSPNDLAELALFRPARTLQEKNGELLVILVDALDELRYHPQPESLLDWLAGLGEIPNNVRFIFSSRDDAELLGRLCRAQEFRLKKIDLDKNIDAEKDVRVYADLLSKDELISLHITEKGDDFIEKAITIAGSNLGYLDILARAIDQAIRQNNEIQLQALLELRGIPDTLHGLYSHFLDLIRRSVEHEMVEIKTPPSDEQRYLRTWPAVIKKILSILTVASRPLEIKQLAALGDIRAREDYIQDCHLRLLQFLDTPSGHYRLFHASLGEFLGQESLLNEPTTLAFYVNTTYWHRHIADYYLLGFQGNWNNCDDYGLEHTLYHLLNADMSFDELEKTISDLLTVEFINARGAHSGWHHPLVQDLYRLKNKLPVLVFEPCIEILRGSHRNSLVNQEVLRLLTEVYRLFRYPPSTLGGARSGSKNWIIGTMLEAITRHPERTMLVLETLLEDTADVQMKGVIALAMGETDEPNAANKLLDILFDTTKYVQKSRDAGHLRWCAADGLLALSEPDIVQPLLLKFEEPGVSPWLRQQIIYVLGRMRADFPLEEKYRLVDAGLTLRQDCLPRALDAVYLLAPLGGSARREWSQRYQPRILTGLGLVEPLLGVKVKKWTYPLTIKRALTALGRVGTEDGIAPLERFIASMTAQEEARLLDEQELRLLEAARRARKDLIKRWSK